LPIQKTSIILLRVKIFRKNRRPIEKRYDQQGNLTWAKATAHDLYWDDEIHDSCAVHWRIAGQTSRWFTSLLPRHKASSWMGQPPRRPVGKFSSPPFNRWRFVLAAFIQSGEAAFLLGQEIGGDTVVEVAIPSASY